MMNIDEIDKILKTILSPKRYRHSLNVMEASGALAEKYGENVEEARLAGLVHDCAKDLDKNAIFSLCEKYGITIDGIMRKNPQLLHGIVGAHLAKEMFGIDCPRILDAVADHTMGREGMDKLAAIVFIADYVSADRTFEGVDEIRRASEKSLEAAIVAGIDNTVSHILKTGGLLHPQIILTRNWALERLEGSAGK